MNHLYTYEAELVEVVDGDTFDFRVDLGFDITKKLRVRLLGVDTAEIHGVKEESEEFKRGKRHMEFASEKLSAADEIFLKTHKTGKYGRYLAEVKIDDEDLTNLLKEQFNSL